jgi:hypothetical protein
VLEHLESKAGCPIIIDRYEIGISKLNHKITLEVKSITIKKALDTVCSIAGIAYDVRMKHLFVSSRREILKPYLVTKFYDIRGLTIMPQDIPGPDIELMSGEGDVAITPFAGDVDLIGVTAEEMKELIQSTLPNANWNVGGVSLDFRGGTLAVTNTQDVQESIKQLFLEQQKAYGKMVEFDIQVLHVGTALADTFFNSQESNVLSSKELDTIKSVIKKNTNSIEVLGNCRMICFNSQRTHFFTGPQRSYIRDITPVVAQLAGGIDPELDTYTEGMVMDVRPTVSFDNQWVNLEFKGTLAKRGKISKAYIPVPGGVNTGSVVREKEYTITKKKKEETKDDTEEEKEIKSKYSGVNAKLNIYTTESLPGIVHMPEIDVIRFRTEVRVPDKGGVIFSAGSKNFHSIDTKNSEIVVLVTLMIVY